MLDTVGMKEVEEKNKQFLIEKLSVELSSKICTNLTLKESQK